MNLWINADIKVPTNDETVLAIVSGNCGNVTFENCPMLMLFDGEWYCEDWPEIKDLKVLYWMPIPNLPRELCPYGKAQLLPCEVNCELRCGDCLLDAKERGANEE